MYFVNVRAVADETLHLLAVTSRAGRLDARRIFGRHYSKADE
jgi:hypothetical protein